MNKSITIKPVGSRVSQWGEGPIFWQEHLIYVDIEGHAMIRLNGETGSEETWEMNERIGTVVPCKKEAFFVRETRESIHSIRTRVLKST